MQARGVKVGGHPLYDRSSRQLYVVEVRAGERERGEREREKSIQEGQRLDMQGLLSWAGESGALHADPGITTLTSKPANIPSHTCAFEVQGVWYLVLGVECRM